MIKRRMGGYFTVEAALILPMVILFMTTMLFVGFYVYDRCMLEHCAYEAAVRGSSSLYRSNEEAYEATLDAVNLMVKDKIFAARNLEYYITVTGSDIEVVYECDVNVPLLNWLSQYTKEVNFHVYAKGRAPSGRQVKLIRIMDRIIN